MSSSKMLLMSALALYLASTSQIGATLKALTFLSVWFFLAGGREWYQLFGATYEHTLRCCLIDKLEAICTVVAFLLKKHRLIFRYGKLKMDLLMKKKLNIVQLFRSTARKHAGKTVFIDAASGKKWSYEEVVQVYHSVIPG